MITVTRPSCFNFLGRFQVHMVRGCWQALNHASIAPVTKYRQLAHLKTTFNDAKFVLIAVKKLRPKRSLSWGYNLRKRIVLVLLTAVDLRRIIVCCVTRQHFFTLITIHFFASQRLSEGPACLYNYIHLLLSSFLYKYKFFEDLCHSRSRLFTTMYYVTIRKSLQCFDQRISRAFPGNLHIFNFRLSKQEERMNKNKPKRNSCADQKSAEIKLTPFSVGKLLSLHAFSSW